MTLARTLNLNLTGLGYIHDHKHTHTINYPDLTADFTFVDPSDRTVQK